MIVLPTSGNAALLPHAVRLADGTRVRLRPIRSDDKAMLRRGIARLSPASRYNRFLGAIRNLTPAQLAYLTEVDQIDHIAWIALVDGAGVAVARCVRDTADPACAEVAIVVCDEWQGRGVGSVLARALRRAAAARGIMRFTGQVRAENARMLAIVAAWQGRVVGSAPEAGPGIVRVEVPLGGNAAADASPPAA